MNLGSKIYVAGHSGLLGSAVVRELRRQGYRNILTADHRDLDLVNQLQVDLFFIEHRPEFVIICAGLVGGIMANTTRRGDFIYQNVMMNFNILQAAYRNDCEKVMAVGSSCIYPRYAEQPIKEEYLLTGELEPTNEPYAVAKIAALKMCEAYRKQFDCNFISAMPTNLYGPGDSYDNFSSHVVPALIKKIHESKNESFISIWGTGTVRREFLFVDDCAEAIVFLMNNYNQSGHVNIGTGEDLPIYELAEMISEIVGFKGTLVYDHSKPDGMKRKVLNVDKINTMGWSSKTTLRDGLKITYDDYCTKY